MKERNTSSHEAEHTDEFFMLRAIALSEMALDDPGLRPYGAVVVRTDVIVGEGVNRSIERSDPTSHGEVEAIRAACAALGTLDLSDCTLYTSCEPCPMCRATTMMAGISRVVYGASIADAGEVYKANPEAPRAIPMPADEMRARVGAPLAESGLAATRVLRSEAVKVLNDFAISRTPKRLEHNSQDRSSRHASSMIAARAAVVLARAVK